MKYVSEETMAQMKRATGLGGDDFNKEADAQDAKYQSRSRGGGPLEVRVKWRAYVQFTDGVTSKKRKQES